MDYSSFIYLFIYLFIFLFIYLFVYFISSPAYATPKLLDKVGMGLSDIDVFEYHEAFAVSLLL